MLARQHISESVVQLRRWVTMCAAGVALAAVVQMLVFATVHYTDSRYQNPETNAAPRTFAVVSPTAAAGSTAGASGLGARLPINPESPAPVRDLSSTDQYLRTGNGIALSVGLIGVLAQALLTALGTVIAAGGSIPGVDKTVRSSVWSIILALACLPWSALVSSSPLHGVFTGYAELTRASESARAGGGEVGLHMQMLLLPIVAMVLAPLAAWWFHQGVAAGVIYTHMSEMEEALDREMALRREQGAGSLKGGVARAGVALNLTIAQPDDPRPLQADPAPEPRPLSKAAGAESVKSDPGIAPSLLRGTDPKRPI